MRIAAGRVELRLQAVLDLLVDEVLDTVGRFMEVIVGQLKVSGHVRLPKPMGANERAGALASPLGQVEFPGRVVLNQTLFQQPPQR